MGGKAGGLSSQCGIVFSVSNELAADRDPSLTNFSEQKFFFLLSSTQSHTHEIPTKSISFSLVLCVCVSLF